jgi:hypothetical protein
MIIVFGVLIQVFSLMVSVKELDKNKDYALLYTKSVLVQQEFTRAVQGIRINCSFILCFDDLECDLKTTSSLIVSLDGEVYPYSWEYTFKDFSEFFEKISKPPVVLINSTETFESLSKKKVSFLFTFYSEQDLNHFLPIAEKYKTSHIYFGASLNMTFDKKVTLKQTHLRLLGTDAIFRHLTTENFEDFIEKFKCPLLLEYLEADWVHECFENKVVVTSVINKKRKHMWDLYAGKLKIIAQEANDSSFQMMYVDNRKYSEYIKYYEIPFIPFFLVHDYRISRTFYFGEFSFKSQKRVLKLLNDIKEKRIQPEDFTIDTINYTKYFNIWQLAPLCFLVFGMLMIIYFCYSSSFEKEKKS